MITIAKEKTIEDIVDDSYLIVKDLSSYINSRREIRKALKNNRSLKIKVLKKYSKYYIDFEDNESIIFLENSIEIQKEEKKILSNDILENLLDVIEKSIEEKNDFKKEFKEKFIKDKYFLIRDKFEKMEIIEFLEFLIEGYIFSYYKKYNFAILMNEDLSENIKDFFKEKLIKESFIKNKNKLNSFITRANDKLKKVSNKLQFINEFDKERYIENISGYLSYEREYYIRKLLEELNFNQKIEEIEMYFIKINKIFSIENDIKIIEILSTLKILKTYELKKYDTFEEYKEFYKDVYVEYNGEFYKETIFEKIKNVEIKYIINLNDLKKRLERFFSKKNKEFESLFFRNYPEIYNSKNKNGIDSVIINSKEFLNNGKKTIFIFIDCLRYDLWLKIKEIFAEYNFYCQNEDMKVSYIPTVTKYCKKVLFSSQKYNALKNSEYDIAFENLFPTKKIKKITSIENFKPEEDNEIFYYEITDIDSIFHEVKEINRSYLTGSPLIKIKNILNKINSENYNVVIMTDHGATKINKESAQNLSIKEFIKNNRLEMERHGRYIRIYGDIFDENLEKELKYQLENKEYIHIISRSEMTKYYLPIMEGNKENYFFIIYKNEISPKNCGEYNHGGITLEEVFIPFGIMTNEKLKYKQIDIEVQETILESDKISDFKFLIKNSNHLKNIRINLEHQEKLIEIKEIKGNKIITIPLKINEREGDLKDNLYITFEVLEEKKDIKIPVVFKVIKNKKIELNKKLKRSRSLL